MATSVGDPIQRSSPSSSSLHSAPLFRNPQSATVASCSRAETGNASRPSTRFTTSRPLVAIPAGPSSLGTTRSWTHISPFVSVPVLSEQKTETQPRVSTASILRTSTFLLTICSEAIISEIVTVGSKPSGTCAKSAAQLFCRIWDGVLVTGENMLQKKLVMPITTATPAMMCTKCSIWISSVETTREDLMPCAILPRKVLSPVAWTRHVALPFSSSVPKKAKFLASVGEVVSFSVRVCRGSGIASPVSAALLTSIPSVHHRTRTSAGNFIPASRKIMSPGTRLAGSISRSSLLPCESVRTQGTFEAGCIFCIASIWFSACCSARHCSTAAMTTTSERMIGVM
mmetsp:Transcript_10941/g.32058  ORF Transcript_10941/g.32058 Transcript_10941/m.32058 type:complete len:342 (+) Transcript_10941:1845-2870(+)